MDESSHQPLLPHHQLRAYGTAVEFLRAVRAAGVRDRELRTQALRAAKSVCLNIAEAAGRSARADQARVFTIARGEACEAAAALEIASIAHDCSREFSIRANELASRLVGLLTGLIHPKPIEKSQTPIPKPDG